MARRKLQKTTTKKSKATRVSVSHPAQVNKPASQSFMDRVQLDLENNKSYLNLILGGLVIVILGILLFNYFTKPSGNVGPSQETANEQTNQEVKDVSKDALPGKYTVKEGDTLFSIAQNYYNDGYKYPSIVEANKLADENALSTGQVLEIPKVEGTTEIAAASSESSPSPSPEASASPAPTENPQGQGGAENQTTWGEKINGDTYTVVAGDWLSTIAGRAYGDVMTYQKIAEANNIQNPDLIEPGTVLKLPR